MLRLAGAIAAPDSEIVAMTNGTQGNQHFFCPKCKAPYRATHEQHPMRQQGSFACTDCGAVVHEWDGDRNYFDWKMIQMKPPSPGRKL
jgi:transcription initiation factor IIE alpha subunit